MVKRSVIIFLYGSDGYRIKENVDTIVSAYNKKYKSGMSHYRFDLDGTNKFDDFGEVLKTVSFFDEAKLVVVKNPFSAGGDFLNKLSSLSGDLKVVADKKTVLVFIENRTEKELKKTDKDLFSFLTAKPNMAKDINYLKGTKLSNWVRGKFKENGHDVSPAVISLLINLVGSDPAKSEDRGASSWALANEINKISNYSIQKARLRPSASGNPNALIRINSGHSDKFVDLDYAHITESDVQLLVNRKEDDSIFELTDAVGNQNKAKAFEMVYRLTNSGHDAHYLLSMLVYHFENLLSVYDPEPSRQNGSYGAGGSALKHLHPFVAKKAASQARKFSKEGLLSKFNHLAELDISSKDGLVNLKDALYNFVIS